MRRLLAILGTALFLVIAPGTVAILIPWWISHWRMSASLLGVNAFRGIGIALVAIGAPVLLDSFARFALQGLGTPAPVAPTQNLVVSGSYCYVRNPMYIAVALVIFGQGLLFGSVGVLTYGLLVATAFELFVRLYEEPTLQKTFGGQYESFRANVPRWIPRVTAWKDGAVSVIETGNHPESPKSAGTCQKNKTTAD